MLKIMVNGQVHGLYNEMEGGSLTVGSAETADVCLPWAAEKHLTIHFHNDRGHFVVVHDKKGMWHKGAKRFSDNGWMVFVRMGEPIAIRGHVITFVYE